MTTPFCGLIEEICVMFVHHGTKFDTKMTDLLESNEYQVTTVDRIPVAMSILSQGKEKVDVVIVNVHSPDSLCFKLLKQADALDIVTLFVCDEHDKLFAKNAFDNGTYLYMEKSLDENIMKYLWQFVLRKKLQRDKVREGLDPKGDHMKYVYNIGNENIVGNKGHVGEKIRSINNEEQTISIHQTERGTYKLRSKRCRKGKKVIHKGERQSTCVDKTLKRNDYIEWTMDLREKFKEATERLGDGRCLPKKILEIMNVPGLTRMQVANYLQRCRINQRRPLEEQTYIQQGSSSGSQQRIETSSYKISGRILDLQTNVPNQIHGDPEFSPVNTNNIYASSTEQQLCHPELHSNSGDHHDYNLNREAQNDYSSSLNQVYVTTNSTSAMMTDMNGGNAIIKGPGAANTNFQQYIGEQNMFVPSNTVATSNTCVNDISDLNEWENCDAYLNFHNMDYLYQNIGASSSILPNEHGSEYDQVYSFDQIQIMPPQRVVRRRPARMNVDPHNQRVPNAAEVQPQGEVTNDEFRDAIRKLSHVITNQARQHGGVRQCNIPDICRLN
ncbi:two-component response regulator ARR14-like [Solanum stenotomum]|uniref:two-component response regulator ARR14-like n=1 Tax=Solanum stenotomum TaxID=172797 RepID=UPI0020D11942|nr:two-component response regulator ARR14-like [Solanum stenotomum]